MPQHECIGYCFDLFEVQLGTDVLLRNGHAVRIQQLPFQTLVILLENAGRTVTREELRRRLWSDRSFMEFDNNLRVAVTKLREALGEQAAEPRFIKTVARKGYQFIGDVVPVFAAPAADVAVPPAPLELAPASDPVVLEEATRQPPRLPFRLRVAIAVLAVFTLAGGMAIFARWHRSRPLASSKDKVVFGVVLNESGDPAFDGVLTTAFRLKLQESPYLSAVREEDFQRLAGQSEDAATISGQIAACKALGASFLLTGRLAGRKPGYQLQLDILRCSDGQRMSREEATAATQAEVLPALDQTIQEVRRQMGESETSLERFNVPIAHLTTNSMAALRAFMLGNQRHLQGQETQAISDFKLAVDLDPRFAIAYAHLGTAYFNTGDLSEAQTAYETAFRLREQTTDRERLYIAASYYSRVTGEIQRTIEVYQLWQSIYPRDVTPAQNLAGVYLSLGKPDRALQMAKLAIDLDPSLPRPYALMARAYLGLAKYGELNKLCSDPARMKTDVVLFHTSCYLSAFAQSDDAAEQHELEWAHGKTQECILLEFAAWTALYQGKARQARQTFAEARQRALAHDMVDFAAELDLDEAGLDADLGEDKEARVHALDALRLAPHSRSVQAFSALALARAGDVSTAESEAVKAAAQAPLDEVQRDTLLASTRASIQLRQRDLTAALQSMEAVRPYDDIAYMALFPAYYRGLILAEDHQYGAAARTFQQVIDHRALYPQSIYSVLSQLQLARVLQLTGHPEEAAVQYQPVRKVWEKADVDFQPNRQLKRWSQHPDPPK